MQAVILAAGSSSRFFPYNSQHKSLICLMGEPIITHTLRAVKRSGINDVILVTGKDNQFEPILGNGKRFGLKITYVAQNEATGMGDAVLSAVKFARGDFFVANANRVEFDLLKEDIDRVRGTNRDVVLLTQNSDSLSDYGTVKTEGERVISLIEKPKKGEESSSLMVVGMYFLNQDFVKTLKSVKSHEYSFEDALDKHAKKGYVKFATTQKETVRLKYPWHLLELKNYLFRKINKSISKKANVSPSAQISGEVIVEDGATVFENAIIKGPAYIGKNVFVGTGALIRNGTDLEEGVKIGANMEVKNSLVMAGSTSHSGLIEDSVIGNNCKIGAFFGTANVRLDRKNVNSIVKVGKVDTGLKFLGVILGNNGVLGERISTMPGVIVGNSVAIGPSTTVMKNVPSDILYYTKFAEIIEKNRHTPIKKIPVRQKK